MNNIAKNFNCEKDALKKETKIKIDKAVENFNMILQGDTIIVGVSGGSDSICLLDYLLKIKNEKNLKIIVAHINHMLRGKESERDENFVRNFCKGKNLPIEVLKVDVNNESKALGLGIEESGRKIRYDFFKKLALKEIKSSKNQNLNSEVKIATAHTLSDSVETIILNLAKGTSIDGLCGIPKVREEFLDKEPDSENEEALKVKIIRPLINLQKCEILNYCKDNNLKFVDDSSNFDDKYTRNKIRLNVIPVLKEINENLESTIARSMSLFKKDSFYLNKIASEQLEKLKIKENQYSLSEFKKLDFAIKSRCVKKIVENFKKEVRLDFKHLNIILDIIEKGEGALMLPGGIYLKIDKNILKISNFEEKFEKEALNFSYQLKKSDIEKQYTLTEKELKIIIKVVTKNEYDALLKEDKVKFKNAIDFDKIPNDKKIYLRNRKEHDKFSPVNRKVTKSLKKFLNEEKVPPENRAKLAILAFENNVMWVENFGVSEKFKVNENTKRVMILKLEN